MSEMIERVARALESELADWFEIPEQSKPQIARELARAAIEAMQNPTKDMLDAAIAYRSGIEDSWRVMNNVALGKNPFIFGDE